MYMEPIARAKSRPLRIPAVDAVIGLLVLGFSALLLLPSLTLYGGYVSIAVLARIVWKNPRAGR